MHKFMAWVAVVAAVVFLSLPAGDAEAGRAPRITTAFWVPADGTVAGSVGPEDDAIVVTGSGLKKLARILVRDTSGTEVYSRELSDGSRYRFAKSDAMLAIEMPSLPPGRYAVAFFRRGKSQGVGFNVTVAEPFIESGAYGDLLADVDALKTQVATLQAGSNKYQFLGLGAQRRIRASDGDTASSFTAGGHDEQGVFDGSRFTAPVDGYYFLHASGQYYLPDRINSNPVLHLYRNGAPLSDVSMGVEPGRQITMNISTIVLLQAGDQVDVRLSLNGNECFALDDRFTGFLVSP